MFMMRDFVDEMNEFCSGGRIHTIFRRVSIKDTNAVAFSLPEGLN